MDTPTAFSAFRWRRISFYVLAFFVSVHFAFSYLTLTFPMVPLGPYLQLQTRTPFRYRVFPVLIHDGYQFVLDHLHVQFPALNPPVNTPDNWFMSLLAIASMFTALVFTARTIVHVTGRREYRWLAFALALIGYFNYTLVLNRNQFYPYDIPMVAAFAGLTYFAVTRNYLLFALWFIPSMVTKETATFGILLFFLLNVRREQWRAVTAYCAALGLVAMAIKYVLYRTLYQPCPECVVLAESHLLANLTQFANPLFWISFASTFAYLWIVLLCVWRLADERLRRAFAILFAVWFAVLLKTTIMRELRLFGDMSPFFVVVLASGVGAWLDGRRGGGEQAVIS